MQYQFVVIHKNTHFDEWSYDLQDLFLTMLNPLHQQIKENELVYFFHKQNEIDLKSIVLMIESDFNITITLFESSDYQSMESAKKGLKQYRELFLTSFLQKQYLTPSTLIPIVYPLKEVLLKKFIFKKYANDNDMLLTLKTFLDYNQNINLTASYLYLHRNTLSQRLLKFKEVTGFDVKIFKDAFLLYPLLV